MHFAQSSIYKFVQVEYFQQYELHKGHIYASCQCIPDNSLPSKFILDWIETEHPHIEMNSYKKIKTWEGRQSI